MFRETGIVGRLHVSATSRPSIEHAIALEPRGAIEIKGLGRHETWLAGGTSGGDATTTEARVAIHV